MNPEPSSQPGLPSWTKDGRLLLGLLLIAVMAASWPGMKAPLLLDDLDSLRHAQQQTSFSQSLQPDCYGLFRPIKSAFYYLLRDSLAVSSFGAHLFGLSAFLIATVTVYFLTLTLFKSRTWAAAASAFWALAPTQASTILWLSCANISIGIALFCAALLFHIRHTSATAGLSVFSLLAATCLFLAQSCYESMIAGLGIIIAADFLRKGTISFKRLMPSYGCYFAITVGFLLLRHLQGAATAYSNGNPAISPDTGALQLVLSSPWFLKQHLFMWLLPLGRIEFLGSYIWGKSAGPLDLAWAAFIVASLATLAITLRTRLPWSSFGIAWFLCASFPSSNLIPIYAGPIEDYYLAFPSIGLAIMAADLARAAWKSGRQSESTPSRTRALMILSLSIISLRLGFALLLPFQASAWSTHGTYLARSSATRPYQFINDGLLARELYLAGDIREAHELAAATSKIAPWYALPASVEAGSLVQMGRDLEALGAYKRAIQSPSDFTPIAQSAMVESAAIHIRETKDWSSARALLIPVLEHGFPEFRKKGIHVMADLYLEQDLPGKAIGTIEKGIQIFPDDPSFSKRLKDLETGRN